MSNRERYNQCFVRTFDVAEEALNGSFNFNEIESWDSMSHLTLISELEETFEVMFESEDILHFGGYENGMKILARYGVEF